jgi:hypothetical protein
MLSVDGSRKHVLFDGLLSFMVLVDTLSLEEAREIVVSLRYSNTDPEEIEFIDEVEKFITARFESR